MFEQKYLKIQWSDFNPQIMQNIKFMLFMVCYLKKGDEIWYYLTAI